MHDINLQPTLTSTRVHLRPLREDDFAALFAVASDPLIWEQHPDTDRYKEENFTKFFQDGIASKGTLIAFDASTGAAIGSSRYYGYDAEKSEVEIGWSFLARSHWGGIYNREMKDLMLRHAFTFAENVVFLIGPNNMRSRRAVEKIGGKYLENRFRGREAVVYRITKQDFTESSSNSK